MKKTTIFTLGAIALSALIAHAENTAVTDPSGYVTVPITPAPNATSTATTAFSISLRSSKKFTSKATSILGQTVTVSGQNWTPTTQWANSTLPHLLYIENASGVEAFLITANTADAITVAASINLESRFANDANIFIVEATTVGKLFGATTQEVKLLQAGSISDADNIHIWGGNEWETFYHNGTNWKSSTNPFGNANNDVIFPDDGAFIERKSTDALELVFTGSVPTKSQLTQVPAGSSFVGSRYPVKIKIKNMGFDSLQGWIKATAAADSDRVFFWNGTTWDTFWNNGTSWKSSTNPFGNADDTEIPGNSALFVVKQSAAAGAATAVKPYNLDPQN